MNIDPYLTQGRYVKWPDVSIDMDWVMKNHSKWTQGMVSKLLNRVHPEMQPFIDFARTCFSCPTVISHTMIRVVGNNSVSDTHPGYGGGFPDLHNSKHVAVCVCVQEPEGGGDWEIDTPDGKLEYPGKFGTGVIIGGDEVHWATRVQGDRLRVTLIVNFTLLIPR